MSMQFNGKVIQIDNPTSLEVYGVSRAIAALTVSPTDAIEVRSSGGVESGEVGSCAKIVYYGDSIPKLRELAEAALAVNFSPGAVCEACQKQCGSFSQSFAAKLSEDVFAAYFDLLQESYARLGHKSCAATWHSQVSKAKKLFDACELIHRAKRTGIEAALASLHKFTKPAFLSACIEMSIPKGAKLLQNYYAGQAAVSIYSVPGVAEKLYQVIPPEINQDLKTAKALSEALDSITQQEAQVIEPKGARDYFKQMALQRVGDEQLAELIVRHSAGYGLLELLLSDDNVQDVYIDSPGNSPVYLYHGKFEECITNVSLNQQDLEKLGSRFRALSGRPFDESSPVINTELPDLGVRVCGLCQPATFAGYGFAFRRHRPAPWTLAQFTAAKMIDTKTAGLLSFLVDGQRSLLVTGPRGAGKSSFLAALIAEVSPIYRMVVIEDTPELPIDSLRSHGLKVQHMRIKSTLGSDDAGGLELSAEDALRTALRLGESVLVIGEVRGPEARSLFEAMRVGAAGNVVMGTIHGSSAYDTWDRIVNDLEVPTTSFKATDAVISLASIRGSDETRRNRRLVSVTEVKKHWRSDPFREGGFNNLVEYSPNSDSWSHAGLETEIIKEVAKLKKFTIEEAQRNIACRAKMRELLVKKARLYNKPSLLEVGATIDSNKEYVKLVASQVSEHGKVDYVELFRDYASWLESYCCKTGEAKPAGY